MRPAKTGLQMYDFFLKLQVFIEKILLSCGNPDGIGKKSRGTLDFEQFFLSL